LQKSARTEREKGNLLTIIEREKSFGKRNLRALKAEIGFLGNGVLLNRLGGSQTLVFGTGVKAGRFFSMNTGSLFLIACCKVVSLHRGRPLVKGGKGFNEGQNTVMAVKYTRGAVHL
jgi:hypothetical protein